MAYLTERLDANLKRGNYVYNRLSRCIFCGEGGVDYLENRSISKE